MPVGRGRARWRRRAGANEPRRHRPALPTYDAAPAPAAPPQADERLLALFEPPLPCPSLHLISRHDAAAAPPSEALARHFARGGRRVLYTDAQPGCFPIDEGADRARGIGSADDAYRELAAWFAQLERSRARRRAR